jgi:hypothetical protein
MSTSGADRAHESYPEHRALLIVLPELVRDFWYSKAFYATVQSPIRSNPRALELDFSACRWFDPIPLLAILCELKAWSTRWLTQKQPHQILIQLGEASVEVLEGSSHSRALKFFALHGFVEALGCICPDTTFFYQSHDGASPHRFGSEQVSLLRALLLRPPIELDGSEPICRPSGLVPSASGSAPGAEVDSFVSEIIQSVDDALFRGRATEFANRDSALQRLRQVAFEIVGNAWEHAYPSGVTGAVYVFARLRSHTDIRSPRGKSPHESDCPLLSEIYDIPSGRFLEFFICDTGRGLTADRGIWKDSAQDPQTIAALGEYAAERPDCLKFPLRFLAKAVFQRPVSRHRQRRESAPDSLRSNVTGLMHVNSVLAYHSDISRCAVGCEWIAGSHPRPAAHSGGKGQGGYDSVVTEEPPLGTAFHFAIGISGGTPALSSSWWSPEREADTQLEGLRAIYSATEVTEAAGDILDVRARMEELEEESTPDLPVARSFQQVRKEAHRYFTREACSIVRVSRNFEKNRAYQILSDWLLCRARTGRAGTLVFCDLSRMQALILRDHLLRISRTYFGPLTAAVEGVAQGARIYVVSENLESSALNLRLQRLDTGRITLRLSASDTAPGPIDLMPIVRGLRARDSALFWERMQSLRRSSPVIVGPVVWKKAEHSGDQEIILPSYLDYGLAAQDRRVAQILRRSLRRVLALFSRLTPIAIDDLVRADLADALRWVSSERPVNQPASVFVLSVFATGSTVRRAEMQHGSSAALVCSFAIPTIVADPGLSTPIYSALEWNPPWALALSTRGPALWERIPGTPFIQLAKATHPIARPQDWPVESRVPNDSERKRRRPTSADSYRYWHLERLLRIGHWRLDRRHGLVEIDHARALQQSAESKTGFYEWLSENLLYLAAHEQDPLLVYPAGRLGAVMIRHLLYKTRRRQEFKKWRVFPLNFLPQVADGFRQIAPLTRHQIETSIREYGSGKAFFVDIGFVARRTLDHTRRLLHDLGLNDVVALGLVNRTTFPALPSESRIGEELLGYWRFDVPTLDDERLCQVCRALGVLLAVRERARLHQPDLLQVIDSISKDWERSDPSLSWWDHGLEPMPLAKPLRKKLGFRDNPRAWSVLGKSSPGTATQGEFPFEQGSQELSQRVWNYVAIENSTQAVVYSIEIARATAAVDYPVRLAEQLETTDPAAAIEVLATYLLLCGADLSIVTKERASEVLLRNLLGLQRAVATGSDLDLEARDRKLRGLATLAFANLDAATKRLMLWRIATYLQAGIITDGVNRVALLTLTSSSNLSSEDLGKEFGRVVEGVYEEQIRSAEGGALFASALMCNYLQITSNEVPIARQLDASLRFWGKGKDHGTCMLLFNQAEEQLAQRPRRPDAALRSIREVARSAVSLVFAEQESLSATPQGEPRPGRLFSALACPDNTDLQQLKDCAEGFAPLAQPNVHCNRLRGVLERIRNCFHEALPRVGTGGRPLRDVLTGPLGTIFQRHKVEYEIEFDPQFDLPGWQGYLILGSELRTYLERLVLDIAKHGSSQHQVSPWHSPTGSHRLSQTWLRVRQSPKEVVLHLWNLGAAKASPEAFKVGHAHAMPVLRHLGCKSERTTEQRGSACWFITIITIPTVSEGYQ